MKSTFNLNRPCSSTVQPTSSHAALAPSILLTIDVEDWFQVENFRECIPFSSWPSCQSRVEKNTHVLLDLFDSIDLNDSSKKTPNTKDKTPNTKISATFFILGWIAKRLPNLVRDIHARGHEVASHGYNHELCRNCTPENLQADLTQSKALLEDIIGSRVYGYRAPSFSINQDVLSMVEQSGYLYDSSNNSFEMHGRYGRVVFNGNERKGIAIQISNTFYELPISNVNFGKYILPWGGGGYFRLIPFWIFILGIQCMRKKNDAYLFYCHPWEFDVKQPRVEEATYINKFRHYVNLHKTRSKLEKLIQSFRECHFISCKQYLDSII